MVRDGGACSIGRELRDARSEASGIGARARRAGHLLALGRSCCQGTSQSRFSDVEIAIGTNLRPRGLFRPVAKTVNWDEEWVGVFAWAMAPPNGTSSARIIAAAPGKLPAVLRYVTCLVSPL